MKEKFSVDDCLSPLDSFEQVLKMLEEFHLDERFEDIKGGGGMIRDKEWLIKELLEDEVDDYDNHYNGGYEDGLAYALKLAHQLDEPEKVVIPQFVATFIEDSRNKVGNIVTAIWEMYEHEYKDVYEWALEDGNDEVLMKAFASGYEIEKEKLYYTVDEKGQTLLFKSQKRGILRSNGIDLETVLMVYGCQSLNMYQLTEKEIKDYDERYLPFMVPINEVNND